MRTLTLLLTTLLFTSCWADSTISPYILERVFPALDGEEYCRLTGSLKEVRDDKVYHFLFKSKKLKMNHEFTRDFLEIKKELSQKLNPLQIVKGVGRTSSLTLSLYIDYERQELQSFHLSKQKLVSDPEVLIHNQYLSKCK